MPANSENAATKPKDNAQVDTTLSGKTDTSG
jgi:hypothetical protein